MGSKTKGLGRHRADYILERGVWRATCRLCGWQTTDVVRRQAATLFRFHIRDATEDEALTKQEPDAGGYLLAPSS